MKYKFYGSISFTIENSSILQTSNDLVHVGICTAISQELTLVRHSGHKGREDEVTVAEMAYPGLSVRCDP